MMASVESSSIALPIKALSKQFHGDLLPESKQIEGNRSPYMLDPTLLSLVPTIPQQRH